MGGVEDQDVWVGDFSSGSREEGLDCTSVGNFSDESVDFGSGVGADKAFLGFAQSARVASEKDDVSCAGCCEGGSDSKADTLGAACYEDSFAVCGVGRGIRRDGSVGLGVCKVSKMMVHVWLGHFYGSVNENWAFQGSIGSCYAVEYVQVTADRREW